MQQIITGIHHITALADDPQRNLDFYSGILGLRLVKKTVNFDAPEVYHFYFGNEKGDPGTIITFFPYEGIRKGRHGTGMLNTTTFSVPVASLDFWELRLKKFEINYKEPQERFTNEVVIYFEDPDGLRLELVFNDKDDRNAFSYGNIPLEHSIRGFYNAEIWTEGYERTAGLLTEQMDHKLIVEKGNRIRLAATDSPGNYIDLITLPDSLHGQGGGGTVHHIAFSTPTYESQEQARIKIAERMLNPTQILDRQYFKSIYFREPGGVLFEIATAIPGFTLDEEIEKLGEDLKLLQQYELYRKQIQKDLKPVEINLKKFK
ncbi:MAG: VOC family protein [Bacteroidia bacterium]